MTRDDSGALQQTRMNDKNRFLDPNPQDDPDDYGDAQPMPKTHEMMESKFLRKEDVGRGTLATVRSLEKQQVQAQGEAPKTKWIMYFEELTKGLVLGPTTIGQCELAFASDNTDDWIGRKLVLYNDATVMFGTERTGGIRVRAPKNVPAAGRPNRPPPPPPQEDHPFADLDDDIPF